MERAKLSELSERWERRVPIFHRDGNDLCSMHERLADFLFCGKEKMVLGVTGLACQYHVCPEKEIAIFQLLPCGNGLQKM